MQFHVSRTARRRYALDDALISPLGTVVLPDFAASRRIAQSINSRRDLQAHPHTAVRAGDLAAMGLIDEVLRQVTELYQRERKPSAMTEALAALDGDLGRDDVDAALAVFAANFGSSDGSAQPAVVRDRETGLEELLMLWLANTNPAFAPHAELFDDRALRAASPYRQLIDGLASYFKTQPTFGPDDDDLITLLRRPALEAPDDLAAQLRWMRRRWGFATDQLADRLDVGLDVMSEEDRAAWMRFHATDGGAGEADASALHGFGELESEPERFSRDLDWMPRLVLIAKSTYVWLDQLSRQYGRSIERLDQIPDEELERLVRAGISGLWLIGLWERSRASQQIKRLRGSPDAVASAYSLMDYSIALDLGGEEAYRNLRDRAWQRGLRLASDMVPNHMGIDSRWVIEHPDWFISRPDAPYPSYTYNGPDLSSDERVGIHIEDHYYDNTDAAVTFKRIDRGSGEQRFVYHGNDGTAIPWNDTAQLDYLKADVREALVQTILHVARLFPVIRFDAAMTLAKKHIQRLWYPEPGSAGAIPSRAEYSISKREFDRLMPREFWREVVDRVAAEAPDTLLLAEAFWLMEGYFVRTLGMHRVYNSAFMNMLRDEKNAEYRLVMKNTLQFDPQILKRYVNFMNNPDERTAVDQFGKGDKYFGVCTLMATMPGLPMFGHGQLEGFGERYGMEFRRAQLHEQPDTDLLARHEREIFPLLHRRELFAEVAQFQLYDFYASDGSVNEDVFAYSNARDGQRTLVVYNNRFAQARGWIRHAAVGPATLAEGLALSDDPSRYLLMRDHRSGLSYVRSQHELAQQGLYLELDAYRCHVFVEMRDVTDEVARYGRLAAWLAGRGVPSLDEALREMELAPLHASLREDRAEDALAEVAHLLGGAAPAAEPGTAKATLPERVDDLIARHDRSLAGGAWVDEWLVDRALPDADLLALRLELRRDPGTADGGKRGLLESLLRSRAFRRAIATNIHDGVEWFNKERFERAVGALPLAAGDRRALVSAAERSGYRLDRLAAELQPATERKAKPRAAKTGAEPPMPSAQVEATAEAVPAARATRKKRRQR